MHGVFEPTFTHTVSNVFVWFIEIPTAAYNTIWRIPERSLSDDSEVLPGESYVRHFGDHPYTRLPIPLHLPSFSLPYSHMHHPRNLALAQ